MSNSVEWLVRGNETITLRLMSTNHKTIGIDLGDRRHAGCVLSARGGKSAKKRAVIAVARKLAVTLLALWKNGAEYQPLLQAA